MFHSYRRIDWYAILPYLDWQVTSREIDHRSNTEIDILRSILRHVSYILRMYIFHAYCVHIAQIEYILRRVSASGTRCCQNYVTILAQTWFAKKHIFAKKRYFDFSWPLKPNPFQLGHFWRHVSEWPLWGLSSAFFLGLIPIVGSEIRAHFWRNNMILRQIWPLVTSGDLNIDLGEKCLTYFPRYSLRAI